MLRPETSLIILTFNRWDLTRACLDSLLGTHPDLARVELIWLDNASTDETAAQGAQWREAHANAFHTLRFVQRETNNGFLGGVNQAVPLASGDYLCLCNNDVRFGDDVLSGLTEVLHSHPRAGAVGPVSNGMPHHQYAESADGGVEAAPVVYGFCVMTRRECWAQVGLLDERYGRGVVEVEDWCRRLGQSRWQMYVHRGLFVAHDEPHASYTGSSGKSVGHGVAG